MATSSQYLLAGSAAEVDRLRIQALAWEPQVEIMLNEVGVQRGWRCIDVGCGSHGILGPLARRVGPTGAVLAFDRDPGLLDAARRYCAREAFANVEFHAGDLFSTAFPAGSFDLVHARFVLAPLGRDHEVLARLLALVRSGGIIALQEPDAATWTCTPPSPAWDCLKRAVLRAFELSGGDFNAGARLRQLLARSGVRPVHLREVDLTLAGRHPYSRMLLLLAQSLRPKILAHALLTESAFDDAIRDCGELLDSSYAFTQTFRLVQAWGRVDG